MKQLLELKQLVAVVEAKVNTIRVLGSGTVMPTGLPSFTCSKHSQATIVGLFQSYGYSTWNIGRMAVLARKAD